jgi:hypothetical protein
MFISLQFSVYILNTSDITKIEMVTGVQPKLLVSFDEQGNMRLDENQAELLGLIERDKNWRLIRERDGMTAESKEVLWIEFNEEGKFKSKHDEPALGRSLVMSPFGINFTWQTTELTEIIEQKEKYIKFKTRNSVYELWNLNNLL